MIKDILNLCAIDRATFIDLNEEIIKNIEEEVNKNKYILKGSCYSSAYDKDEQFKFLFGHRLLLKTLPEKYKLFCKDGDEKKKSRKIRLLKLKGVSDEEIDDPTENSAKSTEEVKELLIKQLNSYAQKNNKDRFNFTANLVEKLKIQGEEAYCIVECPICEKKIPCVYVKRWMTSNFYEHIRTCDLENQPPNPEPNQTARTLVVPKDIQKVIVTRISSGPSILSEVDKIVK